MAESRNFNPPWVPIIKTNGPLVHKWNVDTSLVPSLPLCNHVWIHQVTYWLDQWFWSTEACRCTSLSPHLTKTIPEMPPWPLDGLLRTPESRKWQVLVFWILDPLTQLLAAPLTSKGYRLELPHWFRIHGWSNPRVLNWQIMWSTCTTEKTPKAEFIC